MGALAPGPAVSPMWRSQAFLDLAHSSGFTEGFMAFDVGAMWNQAQQGACELAAGDVDAFAAVPVGRSDLRVGVDTPPPAGDLDCGAAERRSDPCMVPAHAAHARSVWMPGVGGPILATVSARDALAPGALPQAAQPSAWQEPSRSGFTVACIMAFDAWKMWSLLVPDISRCRVFGALLAPCCQSSQEADTLRLHRKLFGRQRNHLGDALGALHREASGSPTRCLRSSPQPFWPSPLAPLLKRFCGCH